VFVLRWQRLGIIIRPSLERIELETRINAADVIAVGSASEGVYTSGVSERL